MSLRLLPIVAVLALLARTMAPASTSTAGGPGRRRGGGLAPVGQGG